MSLAQSGDGRAAEASSFSSGRRSMTLSISYGFLMGYRLGSCMGAIPWRPIRKTAFSAVFGQPVPSSLPPICAIIMDYRALDHFEVSQASIREPQRYSGFDA